MDVFFGTLTIEIPMADSIVAITDIITIQERDKVVCRIEIKKKLCAGVYTEF